MNFSDLWQTLTQPYAPLLPTAQSLVWARHAIWSLVLAALGLVWLRRSARSSKLLLGVAWLPALWAWIPGPWGIAYWLGLAFQIPSLVSAFLALYVLLHRKRNSPPQEALRSKWVFFWLWSALVLGAVLGLDTFAVFAFAVYPWGFGPLAFALAWALALLPWVVSGNLILRQPILWAPCAAMALFTLTGWPTGNVWDALLDPWLWLLAVGCLLRQTWRRLT